MKQILMKGEVFELSAVAHSVIVINAVSGVAIAYLFDLGDGQTLVLGDSEYESPVEAHMPWPARTFSLVFTPDKEYMFGIYSKGEALPPVQECAITEIRDDFDWGDDQPNIKSGTPATVLASMRKPSAKEKAR